MRGEAGLAFIIVVVCGLKAYAAPPSIELSAWQGEWGEWGTRPDARSGDPSEGRMLRISACGGDGCHAEIACRESEGHCNGSGVLRQGEADRSVLLLAASPQGGPTHTCQVTLQRVDRSGETAIVADGEKGDCTYFCTPKGSFEGVFPLRSREPFEGSDIIACYEGSSPARMAVCESKTLAQQEEAWRTLAEEVAPLKMPSGDGDRLVSEGVTSCDEARMPVDCLEKLIVESTAQLLAARREWEAQVSEPGDPSQASKKGAAMGGRYRHSFSNSDVQGRNFQSTNTLDIQRQSATAIAFKAHLEFFNGHMCDEEGVADYKRGGFFVLRKKDKNISCVLEIIPTETSVRLADPTGQCRLQDCGARGGWNGAEFQASERLK